MTRFVMIENELKSTTTLLLAAMAVLLAAWAGQFGRPLASQRLAARDPTAGKGRDATRDQCALPRSPSGADAPI